MKKIILLFVIFLTGCTGHHLANDFDLIALNEVAPILLDSKIANGIIEEQWWPVQVHNLKPKLIRKNDKGIYIVLSSFFVSESGLFIKAHNININTSKVVDPSYILLQDQVYSYYVKG